MTWKDLFNRPKFVFGLLCVAVLSYLAVDEEVIEEFMEGAWILLKKLLVLALSLWAIRYMLSGLRSGGGRK
jgi:hypothetical protein